MPAKVIEPFVAQAIAQYLRTALDRGLLIAQNSITVIAEVHKKLDDLVCATKVETSAAAKEHILQLLKRAKIQEQDIALRLEKSQVALAIDQPEDAISDGALKVTIPFTIKRRGVEAKLITGDFLPEPDLTLQKALAQAHSWLAEIKNGKSIAKIANQDNTSESLIRARIKLAFLAPQIQSAILAGTQPQDLTLAKFLRTKVDLDWHIQAKQLGFEGQTQSASSVSYSSL